MNFSQKPLQQHLILFRAVCCRKHCKINLKKQKKNNNKKRKNLSTITFSFFFESHRFCNAGQKEILAHTQTLIFYGIIMRELHLALTWQQQWWWSLQSGVLFLSQNKYFWCILIDDHHPYFAFNWPLYIVKIFCLYFVG